MSEADQDLVDRLDKLYFCEECRAVFLFRSDIEEHQDVTGHRKSQAFPFA
jgi:hypothetical protein